MGIERNIFFVQAAKFGVKARGIVHVGANDGEECEHYRMEGARDVLFIEPSDVAYRLLKKRLEDYPEFTAVQALCTDADGERVVLNVANNQGQSSSILAMGRHSEVYPNVYYSEQQELISSRLDTLLERDFDSAKYNMLVIDIQGAELIALKGAERVIRKFDALFLECSATPLYEGGCTLQELVVFLGFYDFGLRWVDIDSDDSGNCLFVANSVVKNRPVVEIATHGVNVALGKPVKTSSHAQYAGAFDPGAVVSGRRTGDYAFHTESEDRPWLEIDLEQELAVSEILVFNRVNAAIERARTLQVFTRADRGDWVRIHDQGGVMFGGIDGDPLRIRLNGDPVRRLRFQLASHDCLHLDAVEVYADLDA